MNTYNNLIVMLTHNDKTIKNAYEIFNKCKNSKAEFFGFKNEPLSLNEMKLLCKYMKNCGKKTVLEVVAYTEKAGLDSAKNAVKCGFDILMGTKYLDSINNFCKNNNLKYMPFVGQVTDCPSVLEGNINEIINKAKTLLNKDIYGIDLLGYRFKGNSEKLIYEFIQSIKKTICVAGSINDYQKINTVKNAKPWAFTIGSAFWKNKFGENINKQINNIFDYINDNTNK